MTRTSPPPTPDAGRDGRGPCVPPADLTAFVMGEGDDASRGEIARHVFGCAACRARRDAELEVVGRLEAFADLGSWEEDLAAADLARAATMRARRRGAFAGAAAAAVLAAAIVGLPFGTRGPVAGEAVAPPVAAAPSRAPVGAGLDRTAVGATAVDPAVVDATLGALLAAQAEDGRWRAATGVERHDVGATGLALLALVRAPEASWTTGPVARAVAAAVRWLAPRADDVDHAGDRERAVAAAALEAVFVATGDRAVGSAAERARRSLPRGAAPLATPDPARALDFVRAGPRELASAR
ncbi:MAG: hypothetical protein U1E39_01125 [Planctomycetota bacterium]